MGPSPKEEAQAAVTGKEAGSDTAAAPSAEQQSQPLKNPPAWASATGQDKYGAWADLTAEGVTQRFRLIPAGTFTMGSPPDEPERSGDEKQHQVTLTQGFWISDGDCTTELWQTLMGKNPNGKNNNPKIPVSCVSWNDCQAFFQKLNAQVKGGAFALPTEAQWEYACRAGTTGPYAGDLKAMCSCLDTDSGRHATGAKQPNAWGLYDMHGNFWQWCADWYGEYASEPQRDPTGPAQRDQARGAWRRIYQLRPFLPVRLSFPARPELESERHGFSTYGPGPALSRTANSRRVTTTGPSHGVRRLPQTSWRARRVLRRVAAV